jgi:hypothetical protein
MVFGKSVFSTVHRAENRRASVLSVFASVLSVFFGFLCKGPRQAEWECGISNQIPRDGARNGAERLGFARIGPALPESPVSRRSMTMKRESKTLPKPCIARSLRLTLWGGQGSFHAISRRQMSPPGKDASARF